MDTGRSHAPSGASAGVSSGNRGALRGVRSARLIPSGPRYEVRHAPLKIIRLGTSDWETFRGVQGLFSSHGAGVLL
jgi:hypothetical protein